MAVTDCNVAAHGGRSRTADTAFGFFVAFFSLTVGLPVGGIVLSILFGLDGLRFLCFIPMFMLWSGGDLRIGQETPARDVSAPVAYHFIPLAVWLVTWLAFTLRVRGLPVRGQCVAVFVVIAAVTIGMQVVMRQFGVYLFIPPP